MSSQLSTPRPRGFLRPSQGTQVRVREFLARYGEAVAFEHFGVARGTLARCAAGLTLQGATLRAIEEGLRTPVAEEALRARRGRPVVPEALAFHHAAEALARAEAEAELAQAQALAEAERQRREEETEALIVKILANAPSPISREDLVSAAGSRRVARVALAKLEITGVVTSWREGTRVTYALRPEATAAP